VAKKVILARRSSKRYAGIPSREKYGQERGIAIFKKEKKNIIHRRRRRRPCLFHSVAALLIFFRLPPTMA